MTTIYVAQPQTELKVHSRQLQVFHKEKFCFAVPINRINQVVILGQHPWTRKAVDLALSLHIPVLYFQPNGQCIEYLYTSPSETPRYWKAQQRRSQDHTFTRNMAESLVRAKLHNARVLLLHLTRDLCPRTVLNVLNLLQRLQDDLPLASSLVALQSYDSTGSALYRAALNKLLPDTFRHQNLGLNPILRLSHLGTALLSQRIHTVLHGAGLDVDMAHLYGNAIDRPPLVCDFLVQFQVPIVDCLVMDLLHLGWIKPEDFVWFEQGIFLQPSALETFIQRWDELWSAEILHPYAGKVTHNHCLDIQVQEYLACLLEDQDDYRPLLLKA